MISQSVTDSQATQACEAYMSKWFSHVISVATVCVFCLLMAIPSEAQGQPTVRQIASDARQAVVTVRAYSAGQEIRQGSGFFIREDGILVTNIHVVSGADALAIELESGEIFDNVYALAFDERRDLIILKIPTTNVPFLEIADDRMAEVGDLVYVVGNPLGYGGTFSDGLLSAKRLEDGVAYLQISAPISQGSSGGPVLNSGGKAIGVATFTVTEGQNLNLAVPARHASGLLSLGDTPVSFEIFAAQLPSPESSSTVGRKDETLELFDMLSPELQNELSGMTPYERQATTRLVAYSLVATALDYEITDDSKSGTLSSDGIDGLELTLTMGSYIAMAVCDDDCTDLDLYVFGPDEEEIAKDVELDADPIVGFDISRTTIVTVGVSMEACQTANCVYMLQLYRKK